MEGSMEIPQKVKERTDQMILLLGIYSKEHTSGYNRDTYTPMFILSLFTATKLWKKPNALQLINESRKYCMYTQRSFTQAYKRMTQYGLKVNGCSWRTSC
jgi:hypothetical protein